MPINPHIGSGPAAVAWYDQFAAELKETSYELLEDCLHAQGMCSSGANEGTLQILDEALQAGALAMAMALEEKGRLRESGDPVDNGLLASALRKLLEGATLDVHEDQYELELGDIVPEFTPAELTAISEVLQG